MAVDANDLEHNTFSVTVTTGLVYEVAPKKNATTPTTHNLSHKNLTTLFFCLFFFTL